MFGNLTLEPVGSIYWLLVILKPQVRYLASCSAKTTFFKNNLQMLDLYQT